MAIQINIELLKIDIEKIKQRWKQEIQEEKEKEIERELTEREQQIFKMMRKKHFFQERTHEEKITEEDQSYE